MSAALYLRVTGSGAFLPVLFLIVASFSVDASVISQAGMLPVPPSDEEETQNSAGDELPELTPEEEDTWLDITQHYFAETVHDFSTYVDESLAKEEDEEALINRSYLRLRFKGEYSHRGYFDSDESVAMRIDLPHVKRNWNLILETDPDDYNSLESKQRDLPDQSTKSAIDGAIGAVRLEDDWLRHWRTNLDLGVKIRLPLDPFVRADIRRVEDLNDDWTAQFKQEVFYYHSLGAGTLSELNFYMAMDEEISEIIKLSSSAQYLYEDDNWELLFQLKYFDRINSDHLMEYATGITIEPNKADEVSNSWISASWRQKIYSNWLYLYITPQVDAPREFDYKLNPGILMELEVFFSKNRELDRLNRFIPQSTRLPRE